MNSLEEIVLSEMSKRNIDFVVDIVCNNPELFDELFQMVISNTEPLSRRAIWALDYCAEKAPELVAPHIPELIENFPKFQHDGLKRHTLRILRNFRIPEDIEPILIDYCFEALISPKESIATKAHAMDILYNFCQREPGLKPEFMAVLEMHQEHASKGIKNKTNKLLRKLKSY